MPRSTSAVLLARFPLLVAGPALLAAACGGAVPSLHASRTDAGLELVAAPATGGLTGIVASRVWSADKPPEPAWKGSVLESSSSPVMYVPPVVLATADRPGGEARTTVPLDTIPEGTYGVQAVENRPDGNPAASRWSRAWILRRSGAELELRSYGRHLIQTHGALWALAILIAVALLLGRRAIRLPTDKGPKVWLAAMVAVVVCLTAPRLWRVPERWRVDAGLDVPPLIWPLEWKVFDDGVERLLGPGFRELEATARARQAPGETITLVVKDYGGFELYRAIYLAFMLPNTKLLVAEPPVPGLSIFFGVEPKGEVLLVVEAGVLAVVPPAAEVGK